MEIQATFTSARRAATIRDVASEAGLSASTVSRALHNANSPISSSTRERVQKAAERLGYAPNALARGLLRGTSLAVAVVLPHISNPYYAEIAAGIAKRADNLGYLLFLCGTDESPEKELSFIRAMREAQAQGIIIANSHNTDELEELSHTGMPLVLVEPRAACPFAPVVKVDHQRGAYDATTHLLELGHSRLHTWVGPVTVRWDAKGWKALGRRFEPGPTP